ncbi:MAG: 3-deoxy-7-phosphoheptulonate synthase, partial [Acidobacteria bacterium]|nr:3-deoxy-7-phosphoheptulonate synthase [Acidobacteriota bacterium]
MIISMKVGASEQEIGHVCELLQELGFKPHPIYGVERVVIGAVGSLEHKERAM